MIVTLDRLTITPVEATLPEACPECGQDFAEPSGLIEIGYMAVHRTCQIISERGVTVVSERETAEVIDELSFATAFRCGGCRKILVTASGEETATG